MKCPTCEGERGWHEDYGLEWVWEWHDCPHCSGTGKINFLEWLWINLPERITEWFLEWAYK